MFRFRNYIGSKKGNLVLPLVAAGTTATTIASKSGSWLLAPGSWLLAPGSWLLAPGSWLKILSVVGLMVNRNVILYQSTDAETESTKYVIVNAAIRRPISIVKKFEKFLLLSIIIAFSHFSFASDISGAQPCSPKAPRCPAGKKVLDLGRGGGNIPSPVAPPGYGMFSPVECLCVDSDIGTSCPAGTTLDKRPLPIASSYTISCDFKSYYRDGGEHKHEAAYPVHGDNRQPLHRCRAFVNVPRSALKNSSYCGLNNAGRVGRDPVTLTLQTVCPNGNVQQCRDDLVNMIEGRVTFRPGEGVSRNGSCCKKSGSCTFATNYYRYNTGDSASETLVDNICTKTLYDRTTDLPVSPARDIFLPNNKLDRIVESPGPFADMQCLSDNANLKDVCECNNGDYEFGIDEPGSCLCPDGTPKPANGECPDKCPADCPLIDNQCTCEEPCPGACGGTYDFTVTPADPAPSRPSTAPAPTSQQCQCISNKCPNETGWNAPNTSPKHPNVTGPITGTGNINDSDKRCPDGGVLKDASLPTAYCERDQICSSVTDEQSCQSQTKPTDYGSCTVVGGGVNTVCIDGGTTAIYPANPDGTCTQGWAVHIGSDYKGSCNPAVSNDPSTSWDCSHHPGSLSVATEIPGDHVDGTGNFSCSCMGTGGTTEYICPNGVPSAQAPGCTCQTSVTENGCGHLTNYVREISGGGSTCDCPDSSWTKNSSTGVCSKTATGSSITTPLVMTSLPGSQTLSAPVGTMTTTSELIADGWTCNPITLVPNPTTVCSKTVTSKICTDGGTYDSGTDKCEMSCVAAQTASSCKCVQENDTCRCGVGWTQVGNKCRRDALASSSKQCECECYVPRQIKNLRYDLGDPDGPDGKIKQAWIANNPTPTVCTEISNTDPLKCCDNCGTSCCFQSNFHNACPPAIETQLLAGGYLVNAEGDGTCGKCLDGNIKPPSPGGCCANGKAVTNLNQCPQSASAGGDPKGIDIAFGGQGTAHFYSVYSTGSMNRPDHICWRRNTNGTTKVQERELMCPPKDDCGGGVRDSITGSCQCQSLNISDEKISQPETYCEYASRDPMRFEDGIIRGDVPSSRQNDKHETDIRFFKTNQIVTP